MQNARAHLPSLLFMSDHQLTRVSLYDGGKIWKRYGLLWPSVDAKLDGKAARLAIELEAFKRGGTDKFEDGTLNEQGKTKYEHFRQICEWWWISFEWHRWAIWCAQRICEERICGFTGSASSAKSTIMVLYGLVSYISDPENTIVFVLTTTVKDAEQRIWKEYTQRFNELKRGGLTGFKMVNREHYIGMVDNSRGGGKGTSIQLVAAGDKDRDNALQKLQGVKASGRLILEADEFQDCSNDVFRAATNLVNNPGFEFKCAGNAGNRLDPHGIFCTPVNGWESVTPEDKEWEIEVEGIRGKCLHLDGYDSPNFDDREDVTWNDDGDPVFDNYDPEIPDRYPYIKRTDRVKAELESKGTKDPDFWRQCRGFWAPSDVDTNTIYPVPDLFRYGAMDQRVSWLVKPIEVLGVDPAKGGGDRFMVHHVAYGICKINDQDRDYPVIFDIESWDLKIIGDTEESSMQRNMVIQVKELAEKLKIPPKNVAWDCSGLDAIAGTIKDNYSRECLLVDFGGSPSDLPFTADQPFPCKEKFDRKVSEMWFIGREFLLKKQLAGIKPDTARELSLRKYETKSGKKCVETKKEMKRRMKGVSPDSADSLLVAVFLLRERFGAMPGGGKVKKTGTFSSLFQQKSLDGPQPLRIKELNMTRTAPAPQKKQNALQQWLEKTGRKN